MTHITYSLDVERQRGLYTPYFTYIAISGEIQDGGGRHLEFSLQAIFLKWSEISGQLCTQIKMAILGFLSCWTKSLYKLKI